MSRRDAVIAIVSIVLVAFILIFVPKHDTSDFSEVTTETVEIPTETAKVSEIVTEARLWYNPNYGEPPEEVQRVINDMQRISNDSNTLETIEESTGDIDVDGYGWVQLQYFNTYHIMDNHLTRSNGSIRCFGHRETWYSTNEAAGKNTAREIPDKHIAEDGTIRDADGFVCVASSDLPFYSIVMTSVGPGKVYDCGCSSGTIDVYTTW